MLKKGSLTNLDVALSAVQLKKNKPETKAAAVAIPVNNAKCSQLFALLVEKKLQFLSNHLVTNLFIAASAINPAHVATGKSLIVETFLGLSAWEGFFFLEGPFSPSMATGTLGHPWPAHTCNIFTPSFSPRIRNKKAQDDYHLEPFLFRKGI
jgi:hypothetical protein